MKADSPEKISPTSASASLRKIIAERLNDNDLQLPPMPGVSQRILQMDPNASSNDLAKVIMNDQAITSSIIRIANSAYYGGRYPFESLPMAITRIGLQQVWVLVLGFSLLSDQFKAKRYKEECALLSEHAIGCAYLSGLLAEITGFPNREDAFFGGLMHDIGKLVIYTVLDEEQEKDKTSAWTKEEVASVVTEYHPNIGAFVATSWNLQPWLQEVTRFHHHFKGATQNQRLVATIAIANRFCHKFGIGCAAEEVDVFADGVGEPAQFKPENMERVENRLPQIKDLIAKMNSGG